MASLPRMGVKNFKGRINQYQNKKENAVPRMNYAISMHKRYKKNT
jgi:hypothetical protein